MRIAFAIIICIFSLAAGGCKPKEPTDAETLGGADLMEAYTDMIAQAKEDFDLPYRDISISEEEISLETNGSIIYSLFDGALPAWLCTGYELYRLDEYGAFDTEDGYALGLVTDMLSTSVEDRLSLSFSNGYNPLDWAVRQNSAPFGDAWFIPGYISVNTEDRIPALTAARYFAEYLDKQGLLTEAAADVSAAEDAWADFSQDEEAAIDLSYRYHYEYPITFSVVQDNTVCQFYGDGWLPASVELYIKDAEEKTLFMEDWFGITADKPLKFNFHKDTDTVSDTEGITCVEVKAADRFAVAHNTALYYAGLCGYITENSHYALAQGFAEFLAYESLPDSDREFLTANADILALQDLNNPPQTNISPMGYKDYAGEYDTTEINTLIQAQSLVRYVFNTYGREGLLAVMPSLDDVAITEMAGETYLDIIEDWKTFLNNN